MNTPALASRTLAARTMAALGLTFGLLVAGTPALGQSESGVVRVNLSSQGTAAQNISIPKGKSAIVELPVDVRDLLVTDPKVADAVLRSPRRIYVMGVAPGQTDAVFFDGGGRRILSLNIRVDTDFSAVAQTVNRIIPGSQVHVEGVNNSLVLSGQVANLADADKAVQIAQQFTAKPDGVVNLLSIAGKEQVMLKVRIVEMQRTLIKQLGFNLSVAASKLGDASLSLSSVATYGLNSALLGGSTITAGATSGTNSGAAALQAYERAGLVRVLAEPSLTAISGESAKFLAGGEFPVPSSESTNGQVSVDFKPYGVGLGFTPVVLSNGRISLKISTEVSELSEVGAFTLATGLSSSLTIPGLIVRRAETEVELPSGGAMMIAGLLQEGTKQDLDKTPGLGDLPVLGALFRSRDYQEGETELVVIVTPYLVNSTNPANLQSPADGYRVASDMETDLLGRMNKTYHASPAAASTTSAHDGYQGPVGYIIE